MTTCEAPGWHLDVAPVALWLVIHAHSTFLFTPASTQFNIVELNLPLRFFAWRGPKLRLMEPAVAALGSSRLRSAPFGSIRLHSPAESRRSSRLEGFRAFGLWRGCWRRPRGLQETLAETSDGKRRPQVRLEGSSQPANRQVRAARARLARVRCGRPTANQWQFVVGGFVNLAVRRRLN